jgi:integrase
MGAQSVAKVTVRKETGKLVIDFTYSGIRCREQTALDDSPSNRKRLQGIVEQIKRAIKSGIFNYSDFFPDSSLVARFKQSNGNGDGTSTDAKSVIGTSPQTPTFQDFSTTWFNERSIEWRRSHIKSLLSTLNSRIIPTFGDKVVGSITKADVLAFRATLAKVKGRKEQEGLSPKRINEIMGVLRQILNEAADRFEFTSPVLNIKKLRQPRVDVNPFSLIDVQRILATVRPDYKDYFTVRFLTGMRTGEVHGLKWKYVDFDLRIIRVRETFVLGEDDYTKTDGSQRDIQMSQPVCEAMQHQFKATGAQSVAGDGYVFCNLMGQPLDNKNFSDRVWYPLLRHLDLTARRPYQMRHTAATLWLASGEAPEWIARQLGHTSTEMLFRVYSRYVPNLTRQDGSAMERLLASHMSQGPLIAQDPAQGVAGQGTTDAALYVPIAQSAPLPIPKPRGRAAHGVMSPRKTDTTTAAQPPP